MDTDELLDIAASQLNNSYAPYSNFNVAAAVMTLDGEVYTGVNVENVSYGLSMCAERIAIYNAISNGANDVVAIAVCHEGEDMPYPCGACLQVLKEFNTSMTVIVSNGTSTEEYDLNELLPKGFAPSELTK